MNGIYRSIWSDSVGTFVAVSENTKSAGKKSSPVSTAVAGGQHVFLQVLTVALMLVYGTNGAAQPLGGVVSAGTASISSGATGMTIIQSTPSAVINWQSFNIGAQESVRFIQPSSSAVMLNRVLSANPSNILGHLSANGKVFLVNPNGILFGKGAQVNVGGLVASMLNITDSDFMAGRYIFSGASAGAILNQGSINAAAGYVALLGANVSNEGIITANMGSVALAAGNAITLDLAGDGLLNVTVTQGAVNALIQNGGLIQADGGQVLLTTQAAGNLLQSVVNNTGVIQAQSIHNHNGTIKLLGDMKSGTVNVSGTLDVSGTGIGQAGGNVMVTGQHVALLGTNIQASGDVGGGNVLIGGGYQGKSPDVQNASAVYMRADSTISADAISNGNGGKVVLWANDAMRAYGSISANGGAQYGNGGLIETSGHWLDVAGIHVSASASKGLAGSWLLDPNNVTIQAAGAETNVTASPNFTSTNDSAIVTTASIQTALNAGTSVIVTADSGGANTQLGDIFVNDTLTWNNVAGPTLTLTAAHDVIVNVGATITGTTGSLVMNAGNDITINAETKTTTGNLTFNAGNDVNLNAATTVVAGNITSTAGRDVNMAADSTITTGTITSIAGRNVSVSAAMTKVTTGDIVLRADNDGSGPGAVIGGTVAISCGSNCITVTGAANVLSIRFNPVNYSTTGAEITAYDANLTGAGVLQARAWVFGNALDKVYSGTTAATVSAFKPDITATLPGVALGAVTNANFDTKDVAVSKLVTFDSAFVDGVFALFAPFGTPAGQGTARASITAAPLTITANPDSEIYNGLAYASNNGVVYNAFVNGETAAVLGGVLAYGGTSQAAINTGSYDITPSGQTSSNYNISYVNGTLTVSAAPLTITASPVTKIYGDSPILGAFSQVGLVAGETIGSVTATSLGSPATANVASYTIIPSNATGGSFIASNYTIDYVSGVLTVLPLVPPISTETISDVVAAEEMLGDVPTIIQDMIPGVNLAWMPTVVLATMPAELLSVVPVIVPAEVLLDDPVAVPEELPVVVLDPAPVPVQIDDPVLAPQNIYRTPFHLPKQDRN